MSISTTRWIPTEGGDEPLRIAVINRGEAAVRFMRTARVWSRRNGRPVELTAFYTDPDARASFVQMADRGVHLGDPFMVTEAGERQSSYLDVEGLVNRCVELGIDAVWPGWGFLGESPELSDACAEAGITFIGPSGEVMRLLGDKVRSKRFAQEHEVPVSPWSGHAIADVDEAIQIAGEIGYPVILKAAAGGGGRGIRVVRSSDEVREALRGAVAEATSAFGDGAVFIEEFVEEARHVEVQILADAHGQVWSLGTRDCSVQRRHQKILEETPAPNVDPEILEAICEAGRRMAQACGYVGAGTAEFLLLPDGQTFYFLEMNARLQVEHTVSECIFGMDLVDAQIEIALGEPLPSPAPPEPRGAAIEARLNAEEPDLGFAPAGGLIRSMELPGGPGVRVDSGFRAGDQVAGAFDSNLAKIIAYGRDRAEAIARLEQALRDTRVVIEGGLTNRAMLLEILTDEEFNEVAHSTRWLDGYLQRRPRPADRPLLAQSLIAAALFDFADARRAEREDLFANVHAGPPQSLADPAPVPYRYLVDGQPVALELGELSPRLFQVRGEGWSALCQIEDLSEGTITFTACGTRYTALCARGSSWIQVNTHDISHRFERVPDGRITADMSAVVTNIAVEPGHVVERGDRLMTLEVMKMEIHLDAPIDGVVEAVHVGPSTQVNPGAVLLELAPQSEEGAEEDEGAEPGPAVVLEGADEQPSSARVLRAGVLGYDVTEAQFVRALRALSEDPELLVVEEILDVLEAPMLQHKLFLEGPYDDALNEARESSAAQTIWFLLHRRLDEDRLSARVVDRLRRLFALHEIEELDERAAVEEALFRLLQTHLRDARRHDAISTALDALLARWGRGQLSEAHTERAIPLLNQLVDITTQTGAHELTLRAEHLAHRLRGFSDTERAVREEGDGSTPLLDAALEHTVTLKDFELRPLPRLVDHQIRCALAVAREDDSDRRVLAVSALEAFDPTQGEGGQWSCPHVTSLLREAFDDLRQTLLDHQHEGPWNWNRVTLLVSQSVQVDRAQMEAVVRDLDTQQMEALGLEKLVVIAPSASDGPGWKIELLPSHAWNAEATVTVAGLDDPSIQHLSDEDRRAMRARRRRQMTPEQLVERMEQATGEGVRGSGTFTEFELAEEDGAEGGLVELEALRASSEREANLVIGRMSHPHERFDGGLERLVIIGDMTRTMGSLAEAECRRVIALMDVAERERLPIEWISFSSGARISFESGTENLDWTARVLRRIIEFTEAGGTIHILVDGPCVGAQSYWNAEATMLNHCRGALFMTSRGYMILTGKRALEHSGCVSAASNEAIGGLAIMAQNGEAQYIAPTLARAYQMLLRHYTLTYVASDQPYTQRVEPADDPSRDVTEDAYVAEVGDFETVGQIFDDRTNPGRKKPFDIRAVMRSVLDRDIDPLERWPELAGGESAVVFHGQLGGQPVCMVGIESAPIQRKGTSPTHGPSTWTSGTLYPESSRKVARAIHASSGVKPVVVLANLSGFDGSPESLRNRQLEFGAEIGRAVVKFDGPIIFCVISRYHGGAYVVFSQGLNERLEAMALEGTFASVIGGGPAAAVVFPRKVRRRVEADERVVQARSRLDTDAIDELEFDRIHRSVHAEIQSAVAREFDSIHSVERAKEVGSLADILHPSKLREVLCERTHRAVDAFLADRS